MAYTRIGYANPAAFPVTGAANIIYVDLSNGNEYLWSGTAYVAYTGTLAGVRTAYQDAAWFAANPTFLLGKGQRVDLLQTGTYKLGDGVTQLSALSFLGGSAIPSIQQVLTAGQVATTTIETTGFIKTGGTSSQFLKADGSVDSASYLSGLTIGTTAITGGTNTKVLYNNAGVVGEYAVTGTGTTAVLSTSPTFTTDITTPKIYGSAASGGTLTLQSTTHATKGTINFGTSGYDEVNNRLGIGTAAPSNKIHISSTTAGDGMIIGNLFAGIWADSNAYAIFKHTSPASSSGYAMLQNSSGDSFFNSVTTLSLNVAGTTRLAIANGDTLSNAHYSFTPRNRSTMTASTNIPILKVNSATTQKSTGADSLQYYNWFASNTSSYVGASTLTLGANFVVEYMQGGTNATVTTSAAIYVPTLALTNTTTGIGLLVSISTGATNNYGIRVSAGTTTGAPIQLTSGTNLTTAVSGVIEYDNTFYMTQSDATRRNVVLAASATKTTAGAPYANDGYITVRIGGTDVKVMTTA